MFTVASSCLIKRNFKKNHGTEWFTLHLLQTVVAVVGLTAQFWWNTAGEMNVPCYPTPPTRQGFWNAARPFRRTLTSFLVRRSSAVEAHCLGLNLLRTLTSSQGCSCHCMAALQPVCRPNRVCCYHCKRAMRCWGKGMQTNWDWAALKAPFLLYSRILPVTTTTDNMT